MKPLPQHAFLPQALFPRLSGKRSAHRSEAVRVVFRGTPAQAQELVARLKKELVVKTLASEECRRPLEELLRQAFQKLPPAIYALQEADGWCVKLQTDAFRQQALREEVVVKRFGRRLALAFTYGRPGEARRQREVERAELFLGECGG